MTAHLSPCPIDRALKSRQADIEAAMLRYLCADVPPAEAAETGAAAKRLVEFLIASLENSDTLRGDATVPNEFRAHFSRFGDGLRPIIKDIFGDAADDRSLARITDGYWHAVLPSLNQDGSGLLEPVPITASLRADCKPLAGSRSSNPS